MSTILCKFFKIISFYLHKSNNNGYNAIYKNRIIQNEVLEINSNIEIGKIIYNERKKKDLTMKELGLLIGLSESTAQRYESGKIKNVSIDVLKKFAAALGVEPEYIIGWDKEEVDEVHGFTVSLVNRLLKENLISDPDDIDQSIIDMVIASLRADILKSKKEPK